MYWPKCLTYGNWGGPGWSGGKFTSDKTAVDWYVPGIDEMDAAFKVHDYDTQYGDALIADQNLVYKLKNLNVCGVWKNIYRVCAIVGFSTKICLTKLIRIVK